MTKRVSTCKPIAPHKFVVFSYIICWYETGSEPSDNIKSKYLFSLFSIIIRMMNVIIPKIIMQAVYIAKYERVSTIFIKKSDNEKYY